MTKLTAVVVTYNSAAVLRDCLEAAVHWLPKDCRIIVVDNASTDQSASLASSYRRVELIANTENIGFGAACNLAAAAAPSEFLLLLNPDVVLNGPVGLLLEATKLDGYAGATGALVGENGQIQQGFTSRRLPSSWTLAFESLGLNRLFPWNPINRKYRYLDQEPTLANDVEQPAGALFLIQGSIWRQLGGFDERYYPVWFEDVDLAKRISDLGLKIRYLPEVTASHAGGHSVNLIGFERRYEIWYGSLLRYSSLHFQSFGRILVCLSVAIATLLRGSAAVVSGQSSFRPFAGVLRKVRESIRTEWRERGRPADYVAGREARTAIK